MTIAEKRDKVRETRSKAISALKSGLDKKDAVLDEMDFDKRAVWGDDSYIGIAAFLRIYYRELEHIFDYSWAHPSLSNYTQEWMDTKFETAMSWLGDGPLNLTAGEYGSSSDNAIHPQGRVARNEDGDMTGMGGPPNLESPYLTDNGSTAGTNQYTAPCSALATAVSDLQTARDADSTYYSDPEKQALLDAFDTLNTDISSYDTILDDLTSALTEIEAGENEYIPETDESVSDIDTYRADAYLGDSSTEGSVRFLRDYFYTADGTESDFDTRLTEADTVAADMPSQIDSREATVTGLLPDLQDQRMGAYLPFIERPGGKIEELEDVETHIEDATSKLSSANNAAKSLLGGDDDAARASWLQPPSITSIDYNPVRDPDTDEIKVHRVSGFFTGKQTHVTRYDVYRRMLSDMDFSDPGVVNEEWSDAIWKSVTRRVEDTGGVVPEFSDTTLSASDVAVYRVRAYDGSNDPNYEWSASIQSPVLAEDEVSFTKVSGKSAVISSVEIRGLVLILDSEPFVARVVDTSELEDEEYRLTLRVLEEDRTLPNSGSLRHIVGAVEASF